MHDYRFELFFFLISGPELHVESSSGLSDLQDVSYRRKFMFSTPEVEFQLKNGADISMTYSPSPEVYYRLCTACCTTPPDFNPALSVRQSPHFFCSGVNHSMIRPVTGSLWENHLQRIVTYNLCA